MRFSKLITAVVLFAATGALASSHYREEKHELAGAGAHEGLEGGMQEAGAFGEMDESFSPVGETSLEEASTNRYCFYGRCLHRRSYHRRCPRGFRAVRFRRCGWWRIRALCCRHRHWARGELEGEGVGEGLEAGTGESELGLEQLDE